MEVSGEVYSLEGRFMGLQMQGEQGKLTIETPSWRPEA